MEAATRPHPAVPRVQHLPQARSRAHGSRRRGSVRTMSRMRTRIKRLIKDAAVVVTGFLVVVGLFYVATTPVISAERQQVDMSYSHSFKDLNDTRSLNTCGKAIGGFDGKAAIGHEHLLGGGMSIRFC